MGFPYGPHVDVSVCRCVWVGSVCDSKWTFNGVLIGTIWKNQYIEKLYPSLKWVLHGAEWGHVWKLTGRLYVSHLGCVTLCWPHVGPIWDMHVVVLSSQKRVMLDYDGALKGNTMWCIVAFWLLYPPRRPLS